MFFLIKNKNVLKNIENGGKKESCVHGKKKSLALRLVEGASKQKLVPRVHANDFGRHGWFICSFLKKIHNILINIHRLKFEVMIGKTRE